MKFEIINDKIHYSNNKHYALGCILYTGLNDTVLADRNMAYHQFYEGKEDILCEYNRACMIYNEEGDHELDKNEAIIIFEKLAEKDHTPSKLVVAIIDHEDGDYSPLPFLELIENDKLSVKQQQICRWYLSQCLIIKEDFIGALNNLKQVTDFNMAKTWYLIGELYYRQDDSPYRKDWEENFKKASEAGHLLAKWRLNPKDYPTDGEIGEVREKAYNESLFWMNIYIDLMMSEDNFNSYMEAADFCLRLERDTMHDECLKNAFSFIKEDIEDEDLENLEQLIEFDYLPARIRYTEHLFDKGIYGEDLVYQLTICKDKGDIMSAYRLGCVLESLKRDTEAIDNYQYFIDKSNDPKDAKKRIKRIMEVDYDSEASKDSKASSETYDEFVKIDISFTDQKKESPSEKKESPVGLASPPGPSKKESKSGKKKNKGISTDKLGQAIIDIYKKKKKTNLIGLYAQVLKEIGVSDKILEPFIIEGAKNGNIYCLKFLGKKWLETLSIEEVD